MKKENRKVKYNLYDTLMIKSNKIKRGKIQAFGYISDIDSGYICVDCITSGGNIYYLDNEDIDYISPISEQDFIDKCDMSASGGKLLRCWRRDKKKHTAICTMEIFGQISLKIKTSYRDSVSDAERLFKSAQMFLHGKPEFKGVSISFEGTEIN